MLKFVYNIKNKYLNINKLKIKMKDFFLKVWAKNMGAHYTWQDMVTLCVCLFEFPPVNPLSCCGRKERAQDCKLEDPGLSLGYKVGLSCANLSDFLSHSLIICKTRTIISALNTSDCGEALQI